MISGKRFSFSVILLDISFSRDIVKKLRELNPEVLIIGLSNLEDNSILYSHYTSIITKPINNLKLLDTIIRTIHKDDISSFELNNVEEVKEPSTQVKILIAEDNQYNIEMLSKMLTNLGYTDIDLAKDGVEALEKLRKTQYNILLLDLKMPRMDGFTLAGIIREDKINIKTCVLTASVLEQDKERCKELGIKYFLDSLISSRWIVLGLLTLIGLSSSINA
jgi:CheY-like chemotaxis protein